MEFLLSGLVIFFVLLAEMLKKKEIVDPVFARKILHIGAISTSAVSVYFIEHDILIWIIGLALPVLLGAVLLGFFKDEKTGRKSFGILYFAISFFLLTFFFGENDPYLVYYPMMILAWSDGLATVIGYGYGKKVFSFSAESKTVEGSLTFLVVSFVVIYFSQYFSMFQLPSLTISQAIFVSIFLTTVEVLSVRSFDNLWVPAGMTFWLLLDWSEINIIYALIIPVLAFLAFRKKALTSDGAIAASILGWVFTVNPQPIVILFPAVFFLIGSVLSKLPGHIDESSQRDSSQVFANGLIPAIFFMGYFIWADTVLLVAGISGFAFALSDTSSSEIGVRMGGKHFQILNLKNSSPGVSGAITLPGSLAGIIFSVALGALVFILPLELGAREFIVIAISGALGNIADSLIGATLQAKYVTPSGQMIEKSTSVGDGLVQGYNWIDNSMTNLLSSGLSCLVGLSLSSLYL